MSLHHALKQDHAVRLSEIERIIRDLLPKVCVGKFAIQANDYPMETETFSLAETTVPALRVESCIIYPVVVELPTIANVSHKWGWRLDVLRQVDLQEETDWVEDHYDDYLTDESLVVGLIGCVASIRAEPLVREALKEPPNVHSELHPY